MNKITIRDDNLSFRTKEAFKTLRSNVEFSGKEIRTIAITSCIPNEGKTEIAFELSKAFADGNKKVLLIDADLRKSVSMEHFAAERTPLGLSNYLVGKCSLKEGMCETDIPGFHFLYAGPTTPNPSELLGSESFTELLGWARENYDYVIIDTPPIGSVIDAAIVGKQCDGVILTIASGKVGYRFAQNLQDQLERAGCHLLGCVLNKVDVKRGKGYYGKYYGRYYQKYYGKYYGNNDSYGNENETR